MKQTGNRRRGGTTAVLDPDAALDQVMDGLGTAYELRGIDALRRVLRSEPDLQPILNEARRQIEKQFGKASQVALEVVSDPEAEDHEELFAFVQTSRSPAEAISRLHRLDEEWLIAATQGLEYDFCVDVEFV